MKLCLGMKYCSKIKIIPKCGDLVSLHICNSIYDKVIKAFSSNNTSDGIEILIL